MYIYIYIYVYIYIYIHMDCYIVLYRCFFIKCVHVSMYVLVRQHGPFHRLRTPDNCRPRASRCGKPMGSGRPYRGTSLIKNRTPLGPYGRAMPGALWWS